MPELQSETSSEHRLDLREGEVLRVLDSRGYVVILLEEAGGTSTRVITKRGSSAKDGSPSVPVPG
jgi:hypothetical protein